MAIQLFKENDSFNVFFQHFLADSISELDTIENNYKCSMGDIIELPDGTIYRRHSDAHGGGWIKQKDGGGGGGGEAPVTINTISVTNNIGTYENGDIITSGTMLETVLKNILSEVYYPTLTTPSATFSHPAGSLYKVGSVVAAGQGKFNFNRGSINPQYTAESQYRSGPATGYTLTLTGASVQYQDTNNNGIFSVPAFTREIPGSVILSGSVAYSAGTQPKDSEGNDYQTPLSAGTVPTTKTIEFILPFYWGNAAEASLTDLNNMTEDLSKKGQKTYRYTNANDEFLYIAYPAAYGNLTHITDELNMENIDTWQRSELVFEGQNYIIYRSAFAITGSPLFTFKF